MLSAIYQQTDLYKSKNKKNARKEKAQFFTPCRIAEYMADESVLGCYPSGCYPSGCYPPGCHSTGCHPLDYVRILDPGAGNGALAAAVVMQCVQRGVKHFTVHFVENDPDVLPLLHNTIRSLSDYAASNGCNIECSLFQNNFITEFDESGYDIVICNPPYKKLRKDSPESRIMDSYVFGQPNLYALFMVKSINLLNDNGVFTFITPRSWTSGSYYKNIRKYLSDNLSFSSVLLFADRDRSFGNEEVLQETLVLSARKKKLQQKKICIRLAKNSDLSYTDEFCIPAKDIKNIGSDNYFLIPGSKSEAEILHKMSAISSTFDSLGYSFKTGPVVEFRNTNAISSSPGDDKAPMYRSANIVNGNFIFPAATSKPQYIKLLFPKLLLKNENTVLLRRLSAKEERRRLQSCVYKKRGDSPYISIENHVNYLVRKDGKPLTVKEVEWINSILMSDDYDIYFRMINGSTQVNAGELNNLPLERMAI